MARSIPACHLKCYAEQAASHGTVRLSRENLATVFRMAEDEIAFRQVLHQIATSGASNRDIVKTAVGALKERPVPPALPRQPDGRNLISLRTA